MKRRLAYFSPLPPARTGIADYSAELLPPLAQLANVTLFSDEHAQYAAGGLPTFPPEAYAARRGMYDLPIYHIGNSVFHERMARVALRYPGVLVLHDYGLHQLWVGQTLAAGDSARYVREMGYSRGLAGIRWAREVIGGRAEPPHFEVALNERLVAVSLGVIVHSEYARQLVQQQNPQQRIAVVPAPIGLETASPKTALSLRQRLNLPPDACLFGSFGIISHTKQLEAALRAFAEVRASHPQCYYLIAGAWNALDVDAPALVARLGLTDAVKCLGYVETLEEFLGWLAAVDAVINLRHPTVGETSAVALRALAAGRALVVYDHGWYAELPSDACLKLPVLDQAALVAGLRRLVETPEERVALGERGQVYARAVHAPAQAATAMMGFVEALLADLRGGRP